MMTEPLVETLIEVPNSEVYSHNMDRGLDVVLGHENIAIVVLMVVVLLESTMIYYLLRAQFKKFDRITDVLHKLHNSITVLNERLGRSNVEKDSA